MGLQRHHLLPRQLLGHSAFRSIFDCIEPRRVGFDDFRRNGLLLPAHEAEAVRTGLPLHRGPHRDYNAMVFERVGEIEAEWQKLRRRSAIRATRQTLLRIDELQRSLRVRLLDPQQWQTQPLNRRDPALDFSHLDRMADLLWGATAFAET